jgi:hypothetical protein
MRGLYYFVGFLTSMTTGMGIGNLFGDRAVMLETAELHEK